MQTNNTSPITINVRQSTGTYIAKANGHKPTASCTTGPTQAAESLARKIGLAPSMLREQQRDGLGYGCSRYTHRRAGHQHQRQCALSKLRHLPHPRGNLHRGQGTHRRCCMKALARADRVEVSLV